MYTTADFIFFRMVFPVSLARTNGDNISPPVQKSAERNDKKKQFSPSDHWMIRRSWSENHGGYRRRIIRRANDGNNFHPLTNQR
jgi:hypothetical protein